MSIVNLTISVDDVVTVLELYNRIQVWRSTTGSGGAYSEITANDYTPAIISSTIGATWTLNGKVLNITLNGADPVVVTFSGTDPLNLQQVIGQINAAIPNLASQDTTDLSQVTLTHPLAGTGSWMQLSGNATTVMGLPTTRVNGQGARPLMGNMVSSYLFKDLDGDPSYYYKTRFYSDVTKSVSTYSPPRQGNPSEMLPGGSLSLATINLVDGTGAPIPGRNIILVPVQTSSTTYNSVNYSLLPSNDRIIITTDEAGHAEVNLIRGTTVRAFFEGSGFAREFIVPDVTSFDLLTVLSTEPDPFSIVQAPPMPIRES